MKLATLALVKQMPEGIIIAPSFWQALKNTGPFCYLFPAHWALSKLPSSSKLVQTQDTRYTSSKGTTDQLFFRFQAWFESSRNFTHRNFGSCSHIRSQYLKWKIICQSYPNTNNTWIFSALFGTCMAHDVSIHHEIVGCCQERSGACSICTCFCWSHWCADTWYCSPIELSRNCMS